MKKKKKIYGVVSFLLVLLMLVGIVAPVVVQAAVKESKTVTMKLGECYKFKTSKKIRNNRNGCFRIVNVKNNSKNTGKAEITIYEDTICILAVKAGKVKCTVELCNENKINLNITINNNKTKINAKSFNKAPAYFTESFSNSQFKFEGFKIKTPLLTLSDRYNEDMQREVLREDLDGSIDIEVKSIKNTTKKDANINFKITFYDKNKKELGVYELAKDKNIKASTLKLRAGTKRYLLKASINIKNSSLAEADFGKIAYMKIS